MSGEALLQPPSWDDWCTYCMSYLPHGLVLIDDAVRFGYCSSCGNRHSMKVLPIADP